MTGKSPDCEVTKIELLNQTGSSEKFLEVHQSLNSNSISELVIPEATQHGKASDRRSAE